MRRVCGCTPASSAATEMTYSALVSAIGAPAVGLLREQLRSRVGVEHAGQRLDRVALVLVEGVRHLHVDRDEQVAAILAIPAVPVGRNTLAAHAQHLAARR